MQRSVRSPKHNASIGIRLSTSSRCQNERSSSSWLNRTMKVNFFSGKASSIVSEQHLTTRTIAGTEYYQLKCIIRDASHNELVTSGVSRGAYSEARFRNDFKNWNGGFHVRFDVTSFFSHFNWKKIINNPTTFIFLGHLSPSIVHMILFSKM